MTEDINHEKVKIQIAKLQRAVDCSSGVHEHAEEGAKLFMQESLFQGDLRHAYAYVCRHCKCVYIDSQYLYGEL